MPAPDELFERLIGFEDAKNAEMHTLIEELVANATTDQLVRFMITSSLAETRCVGWVYGTTRFADVLCSKRHDVSTEQMFAVCTAGTLEKAHDGYNDRWWDNVVEPNFKELGFDKQIAAMQEYVLPLSDVYQGWQIPALFEMLSLSDTSGGRVLAEEVDHLEHVSGQYLWFYLAAVQHFANTPTESC